MRRGYFRSLALRLKKETRPDLNLNYFLKVDIFVFILLLLASAFFSGSETAYLSLGKIRIKQIEGMDNLPARRVIGLLSDTPRLLITILIGNTLVNIAASSILAGIFYNLFGEKGVGFSILAMTAIILVFGEVTPKVYALSDPVKVSFFSSGLLKMLEVVFSPARFVLSGISHSIIKALGFKLVSEKPKITEQEIKSLFSMGKKRGIVKEKEKDMIDSILLFKQINAADIMTPRIDVTAFDINKEKEELIQDVKESKFSRCPVYVHSLDNIVGIIHSKDLLLDGAAPVRDLVKRPFVVPESMRVDDLLQELQKRHIHMAVVTDEYGVTSGVVTIEDILEEIVGEIRDEFDLEKPKIRMLDQKNYEISGLAHIDEVNQELGLNIETDEVDTIGGYVIFLLGRIPQAGDSVEVEGVRFTVQDVSKNRITILEAEKTDSTEED